MTSEETLDEGFKITQIFTCGDQVRNTSNPKWHGKIVCIGPEGFDLDKTSDWGMPMHRWPHSNDWELVVPKPDKVG